MMNIERRGFFSQLAALFAGIPAMLGMKPKESPKITFSAAPWIPDNDDILDYREEITDLPAESGSFTAHFDPDPPEPMIVTVRLTDEQVKELTERFESLYKGPRDANSFRIILDGAISDIKPL